MLCSNLKTSFRPLVIIPVLDGGLPLIERVWNSSKCMWIGCCHPPELFWKIHFSTVFRLILKRGGASQPPTSCPLTCHCPLPRSNRKVRVMRGASAVFGKP